MESSMCHTLFVKSSLFVEEHVPTTVSSKELIDMLSKGLKERCSTGITISYLGSDKPHSHFASLL